MVLSNSTKGVKQDCCFSPTLFKTYLYQALKEWVSKCRPMGVQTDSTPIYTVLYADDQEMILDLRSATYGMHVKQNCRRVQQIGVSAKGKNMLSKPLLRTIGARYIYNSSKCKGQ